MTGTLARFVFLWALFAVVEFLAAHILAPTLRPAIILAVLCTVSFAFTEQRATGAFHLFLILIAGGLAAEAGSAVQPGVVFSLHVVLPILLMVLAHRLVSPLTVQVRSGLVAVALLIARSVLVILTPGGILTHPVEPAIRVAFAQVILPAMLGILVAMVTEVLFRHPLVSRAFFGVQQVGHQRV